MKRAYENSKSNQERKFMSKGDKFKTKETIKHPKDGGDMFLRNVGSYKNHTASSYPRRQYSSSKSKCLPSRENKQEQKQNKKARNNNARKKFKLK
jgi:hypothetical protein